MTTEQENASREYILGLLESCKKMGVFPIAVIAGDGTDFYQLICGQQFSPRLMVDLLNQISKELTEAVNAGYNGDPL